MPPDPHPAVRARVLALAAGGGLLGLAMVAAFTSLPPAATAVVVTLSAVLAVLAVAGVLSLERAARSCAATASTAEQQAAALGIGFREDMESRDAVLSAMSEGVLLFDPAGRLAYANRAARTILGRRFDTANELSPRPLREAVVELRRRMRLPGQPEPVIKQFETADAVVEATALPTDTVGTVVVVLRDVTRARSVERLRRDFVANASHELKTPVASILALSETLGQAAGDDPEAVARFLSRLEKEAERLAHLVGDLLELSRLEGGAPEPEEVRLDRVVTTEAERLRSRAEGAGLRLRVEAVAPVLVSGSEADLELLVHNLLDNAVRYTPEGGEVRVSVGQANGSAELVVDDTGIGIPSRDLDRIFERFYRVDAARSRETGGTGLGLSIVRHVAEAHGGAVQVRSVLGAGSTFVVRLPVPRRMAR
jgi:signal transduction histidine kinase